MPHGSTHRRRTALCAIDADRSITLPAHERSRQRAQVLDGAEVAEGEVAAALQALKPPTPTADALGAPLPPAHLASLNFYGAFQLYGAPAGAAPAEASLLLHGCGAQRGGGGA
jgi:hypothetical protein